MPLVEIAVIKDYFSKEEKKMLAKAVKNVIMEQIKAIRSEPISTWIFVREVDVMEKSE